MIRLFVLLVLLLVPDVAAGQDPATASLLADWRRNERNVLAYIEAIPDSALSFRPTPGVRTLAEQFDHIVSTNLDVATAVRGLAAAPTLGDPHQYLQSKSALRAYAEATYVFMLSTIEQSAPADLGRTISVYGVESPALRFVQLSLEHSIWTLGQVVPYLRLNGVTPPAYEIPF